MSAATASTRGPSPSTAATTPLESSSINDPQNASQEKNWLRLQFLLKQSKVYSSILADKMKAQLAAQRAKEQKEKKEQKEQKIGQKEKEEGGQAEAVGEMRKDVGSKRTTRSGKTDTQPAQTTKKRGRGSGARGKKTAAPVKNSLANYLNPSTLGETQTSTAEALAAAAIEDSTERLGQNTQLRPARQPKFVTGGIMKPYQLEGLDWLCSLYENGLNGILADEMGLGKTLQTISFVAFLREKGSYGPFLVVAPVSTLTNWIEEINR